MASDTQAQSAVLGGAKYGLLYVAQDCSTIAMALSKQNNPPLNGGAMVPGWHQLTLTVSSKGNRMYLDYGNAEYREYSEGSSTPQYVVHATTAPHVTYRLPDMGEYVVMSLVTGVSFAWVM